MRQQQSEQELLVTDSATFPSELPEPSSSQAKISVLMKIMHCILSVMQMEAII